MSWVDGLRDVLHELQVKDVIVKEIKNEERCSLAACRAMTESMKIKSRHNFMCRANSARAAKNKICF